MPCLPKDYSKTLIYKLVCNDLSIKECYVGHTTDFTRRKQAHKGHCNNEKGKKYNLKVYTTIRENGNWVNWTMVEIEKYPCKDANEAKAKEREWFEVLHSSLNMIYPQRNDEEYRKQYRENQKEEIALSAKQHYQDNRDNILIQKKQYDEKNREKKSIRDKERRDRNKEEILTKERIRGSRTFTCGCGKQCSNNYKFAHSKTKFHKQYMERVMLEADSTTPDTIIDDDADTLLVRGICYIPLEQFENIKQQEDINEDHFYFSNHYDYMHQQ
jgi:hypothetical protein